MNVVPYLKFVALPVSEIIGGTLKRWPVPGYAVQSQRISLKIFGREIIFEENPNLCDHGT